MSTRESKDGVITGVITGIMDRDNVLGSNSNVSLKCTLKLLFVIWLHIFTHEYLLRTYYREYL